MAQMVKNPPAMGETWVQLLRRQWQPTPLFLPGQFHGQKRLMGYSPWGHKERDTTERLSQTCHTNINYEEHGSKKKMGEVQMFDVNSFYFYEVWGRKVK